MKIFNTNYNIGKAKYVINTHDGVKKHNDGSMFFDIHIFKNKKDFLRCQKELEADGFLYGDSSFRINELNLEQCYSSMQENELIECCEIISKKIDERFGPVCSGLNISVVELQKNSEYHYVGNRMVRWFVFGIQDNFKVIEIFLCEIKNSKLYKEFKKSKETE